MGMQLATIPLTLGVLAAGFMILMTRFLVRIVNQLYTYIGFVTATSIQFFISVSYLPFATGLILSCIVLILLGSLGRRYATISYGCLVVSVYSMLGVNLFDDWYMQPSGFGRNLVRLNFDHQLFTVSFVPYKTNFHQLFW